MLIYCQEDDDGALRFPDGSVVCRWSGDPADLQSWWQLPKQYEVSSRGAWEGRRHSRSRSTSQYQGERRRHYSTSSSPDAERDGDQSSPLAIPLQNGRFNGEARHRTTSEFCSHLRDSLVKRPRNHELQVSMSARHSSKGANAGQRSVPTPSARRDGLLISDESDDESTHTHTTVYGSV